MNQPLISVIMASYNHKNYLREAVESVWMQSYPNIELVVVDDASTDGSIELLKSLLDSSPIPMRVEFNEQNRGPAFTIGRAFEFSSGELIAFLASDDVYAPSRFEAQMRCFYDDPQLLLSFADALVLNQDNTYGVNLHDEKVRFLLSKPSGEILTYLYTHVSPLHLQCALVKKSLLLNSKAFDRSALADDWLTNIRMFEHLAQEGHCNFIDQIVCYYRHHEENLHKNTDRQMALIRQTIERYTPAHQRHLARANIYWDIGLYLGKTKPIEALKYLFISQFNHFRPLIAIGLARKTIWYLFRKLTS